MQEQGQGQEDKGDARAEKVAPATPGGGLLSRTLSARGLASLVIVSRGIRFDCFDDIKKEDVLTGTGSFSTSTIIDTPP